MRARNLVVFGFIIALFSCNEGMEADGTEMEVLPYFDLAGFVEKEISELPDSMIVNKGSRVNWEQNNVQVVLSREELAQELEIFKKADINKPTFARSYDTKVVKRFLIHDLMEGEKGKLKNMTVTYGDDQVTAVTIKMKEENIFYSSSTVASLYFSASTFNLDHYSIETTQKIRWMDPNNMKISGSIRMN